MTFKRTCAECRDGFTAARLDATFCSTACKSKFNNRRISRGLELIDRALHWRGDRKDKEAFTDLCFVIDGFLRDDRAIGRVSYLRKPHTIKAKCVGVDWTGISELSQSRRDCK